MTELVLQTDLDGLNISFVEKVEGVADLGQVNALLDMWGKAVGRQRSKMDLAKAVIDLLNAKRRIVAIPEERKAYAIARAHAKVELRAGWEANHNVRGRRGEFKPSQSQQTGLEMFDKETDAALEKLDGEAENCAKLAAIFEAQIERLRGVINGADQIDVPLKEAEAIQLPRAADAAD